MTQLTEDVQATIDLACANLREAVKDMGVDLKFGIADLANLERVLLAVRDVGDEPAVTGACFMAGAYVGEILRRSVGGQWGMSADGVLSLCLPAGEKIFPVERARKFVQSPAAEGLVFYVEALLARNSSSLP